MDSSPESNMLQLPKLKPGIKRGRNINQFLEDKYGKVGTSKRDDLELFCKLEELGELIQAVREQTGISQDELGLKMGVKKAQISRLEKTTGNLSVSTLIRLFQALNTEAMLQIKLKKNITISLPLV